MMNTPGIQQMKMSVDNIENMFAGWNASTASPDNAIVLLSNLGSEMKNFWGSYKQAQEESPLVVAKAQLTDTVSATLKERLGEVFAQNKGKLTDVFGMASFAAVDSSVRDQLRIILPKLKSDWEALQ